MKPLSLHTFIKIAGTIGVYLHMRGGQVFRELYDVASDQYLSDLWGISQSRRGPDLLLVNGHLSRLSTLKSQLYLLSSLSQYRGLWDILTLQPLNSQLSKSFGLLSKVLYRSIRVTLIAHGLSSCSPEGPECIPVSQEWNTCQWICGNFESVPYESNTLWIRRFETHFSLKFWVYHL